MDPRRISTADQYVDRKFSQEDRTGFLRAQRLAYQCTLDISREIEAGWTEKRAARLMAVYLRDHGVKTSFHTPFAWFGDRSRFQGFKYYWNFMPSDRRIEENDIAILDCAPILDGYTGDVGFTFSLNPDIRLRRVREFLRELRVVIPRLFESELSRSEVWAEVNRLVVERGYENCHSQYPFRVLGHEVRPIRWPQLPGVLIPFSWQAYHQFLSGGIMKQLLGPKNDGPKDGFWAIEPHLGGDGFGAKFEEILVVENGKASWLDDQVPHL